MLANQHLKRLQPIKTASTRLGLLLVSATLFASCALAGAISVNGSCELGNCTTPDSLSRGQQTAVPFNFNYTFGNTDQYSVSGAFAGAYGVSTIIAADVTVTYVGNSTASPSANDTLVVDFLQNFATGFPDNTNNTGFESINGTTSGSLGAASSIQRQYFTSNGTTTSPMAVMGPFTTSPFSASYTGQPYTYGPTTLIDSRNTFVFGAGSQPGSSFNVLIPAVATVPEPSSLLLIGGGLLLLLRRSAKSLTKRE